jgi:hypothetical protein
MIKSAAGAASYLVGQANRRADLAPWYEGVIVGAFARRGPDHRRQFRLDRRLADRSRRLPDPASTSRP